MPYLQLCHYVCESFTKCVPRSNDAFITHYFNEWHFDVDIMLSSLDFWHWQPYSVGWIEHCSHDALEMIELDVEFSYQHSFVHYASFDFNLAILTFSQSRYQSPLYYFTFCCSRLFRQFTHLLSWLYFEYYYFSLR